MDLTDQQITIQHQIQLHKKMIQTHRLAIQALHSLLPEKNSGLRPIYVINPKTGKREEIKK